MSIYIHAEERCVMCGQIIPEGRMVCPMCEEMVKEMTMPKPVAQEPKLSSRLLGFMKQLQSTLKNGMR